jgi:hypothetical protein
LHSAVEDQHGGGGEFRVTGTGRRVDDPNLRALASAAAPGGFRGSSQHLEVRSCDGQSTRVGDDRDGTSGDALARPSAGRAA